MNICIQHTKNVMKTITSITALIVAVILFSCTKKMSFQASPVVPAASGKVKYKKDDNNNYTINVDVENLAEAKNLSPSRELYVVWMESDTQGPKSLGQIKTSSGLFSSKLKGSLIATSTTKPKKVYITAEDNATVQYPGSQRILSTD